MTKLRTQRLVLVPLSDGELAARMEEEPDPHDRAAYGEMLDGCRAHPRERLFYTAWEIREKRGGPVGDVCCKGTPVCGEVEIGYGIAAYARGKGYATEAVRALIDWALAQEGVYYIMAERERDNRASAHVLEKLGFQPAGEGEEGPRFELEKPVTAWTAVYLPLGISVGLCFGTAMGNLALGMCLGATIGTLLGVWISSADKKAREAVKKEQEAAKKAYEDRQ